MGIRARCFFDDDSSGFHVYLRQEAKGQSPCFSETTTCVTTKCLICRKEFRVPKHDYRYAEIKYRNKHTFACDRCSRTIQEEAIKMTGINPDEIDKIDQILRNR